MRKISLQWRLLFIFSIVSLSGFTQNKLGDQSQSIPVLETGAGQMPNTWIDNETGHRIIKLTPRPGINSSFYFHNNPFVTLGPSKDSKMVFFGIDSNVKNAYTVNLKTKAIEQITFDPNGMGGEIIGHKYNNIYYQSKNVVYVTNIQTKKTKAVFTFPDNYQGHIATVNADETFLAGSKASDQQAEIGRKYPDKKDFFDRIFDAHLPNDLFTINIKTGKLTVIHTEPTWLGHVQFSPSQPNLLMFCHEGPWHKLDRIWHINIQTKEVKLMHKRTMDMEIAGHEWFAPDGKTIWFDLQQPRGEQFFVAGTNVETGKEIKYKLKRDEWSIHFNISDSQKEFCGDGGDSGQVARAKDGRWIYHFIPSGDSLKSERLVNMKNHNYHLEPNVHFSPDGKWIIFRANFEGEQNVYAVEIKKQMTPVVSTWPTITRDAKPWTRWWWMGSAVDNEGLDKQLTSLHNVGFGGVAVVPVYGAIGYEQKYLKYLSPSWMNALDYTTAKASSLNMGVDISVGTGWPIGGPQVSVQDAATKLIVQTYTIKEHEGLTEKIYAKNKKGEAVSNATLSALIAYGPNGQWIDLIHNVDSNSMLNWKAEKGDWQLYAAFVGKTGQLVKRAAYGGEGFVLDHFASTSVNNYFKSFDTAFGKSNHGVHSFYNDSYEVFDANWSPIFFESFKIKRGYDLKTYLKNLVIKSNDSITAAIKSDYRLTMNDLLLENFAHKFTNWAHDKKSMNTNESHGSPGNLLDLYAAVDIPEAEIFGNSKFDIPGIRRDSGDIRNVDPDPIMLKFASSAAHVMGKKLVSNETFTWLTDHFKTSWSQCKPEVEQTFLAGINHVFYHGTTYSPANIAWPGWLFYASVNFVPTNSLWPSIAGLNNYITRCQSVLQLGVADNEILSYWPVYDQWNKAEGLDMPFKVHNIDEWLYPTHFYKNVKSLQNSGYTIDFASDEMLSNAFIKNNQIQVANSGAAYKVLLVPQCDYMPLSTLQNIFKLAASGLKVVMQGFPTAMPGLVGLSKEEQEKFKTLINSLSLQKVDNNISEGKIGLGSIIIANNVQLGLDYAQIKREALTDIGLKFISRKIENGKYYYIVNHTAKSINQDISLNIKANQVYLLNPQTGATGAALFSTQHENTSLQLQLEPGEAIIVKAVMEGNKEQQYHYVKTNGNPILLNHKWDLNFSEGGPFIPTHKTLDHIQPWTNLIQDSTTQSFSGTGTYSTHFTLSEKTADDYLLTLDKLYESATVIVNGADAGIIWSLPYKLNIGKYLKQGDNEIAIKVNNLMANRIAYMDRNKIEWKKYHEINFVNIDYKHFDASNWKVQVSGIEGKVLVTPVYYIKQSK